MVFRLLIVRPRGPTLENLVNLCNVLVFICLASQAQDRVRKLQGIKKHEREMERRSAAGVQARLAKLGITSFVPKKAASSTTSTTAKA